MFKNNDTRNYGRFITNKSRPAKLPFFGVGYDRYITLDYGLNSEKYRKKRIRNFVKNSGEILKTCDRHSTGEVLDSQIDNDMRHEMAHLAEEIGRSNFQAQQIEGVQLVQKEIIESKLGQKKENISRLKTERDQLLEVKAQFEIQVGSLHMPLAIPVTLGAMCIDAVLNFSYLQTILYQNFFLLLITVVCLSVMSDGTAFMFGTLYSRKDEKFMDPLLYRIIMGGLVMCFVLSVIASLMIRFGSMDTTYGAINASGEFIGKESYSAAEWGITLVTGFLTTATALISLAVSIDKNQHIVARRRSIERQLRHEEKELCTFLAEQSALEHVADFASFDLERQRAAVQHMEGLQADLKLRVRQLLSIQQNQASYTDAMTLSSERVMLKSQQCSDNDIQREYKNGMRDIVKFAALTRRH